MSGVGAWLRYGGPITEDELLFAIDHYRTAILQPWELKAAAQLKSRRPDMTVLCYKCLSSTRSYEDGPIFSSGVSFLEAEEADGFWFVERLDGTRIEWKDYPGHWQMNVCDASYQARWIENVSAELLRSPFDGVMADNDVFDDYYGLELPVRQFGSVQKLRDGLDELVHSAGAKLNSIGKLLIPNIAESRRQEGRWASHSGYGGGFEEVWLGFDPSNLFDPVTAESQLWQALGPGHPIFRVPTDGGDDHSNFKFGLAAFWIFGGGRGSYSATGRDDYNRTPFIPELDWNLGEPLGDPVGENHVWSREFSCGWAVVNLNRDRRRRRLVDVPSGFADSLGVPVPSNLVLAAQRGEIFLRR